MIVHLLVYIVLIVFNDEIFSLEEGNESLILELKQGKLKGYQETSTDGKPILSFLGIPFAKPPVGNLRFEDPVKAEKWNDVFIATKMPPECLQMSMINVVSANQNVSGTEDCLYLNVFTPKPIKTDNGFPVMVFIHGGAFIGGSAAPFLPYNLLNEDVILVTIQFRVGVIGFLSTEDSVMSGNFGLKDQRMALQWVQENIRSFGGNPNKVTIFGPSAGGGSVHLQMLSPGSKGLFSGVIAQSGTGLSPRYINDQHRKYSKELGEKLSCRLEEESSESFKECVKKIDGQTIVLQAASLYKWGNIPLITVPRVDGIFIPDTPENLLKSGHYNKVNLMSGLVRDEGGFFTMFLYKNPEMKASLVQDFSIYAPYSLMIENEPDSRNLSKLIYDFYLKGKKVKEDPMDELTEMFGDRYFKIGSDLAYSMHAQDKDINLYLYEFNHKGQKSVLDKLDYGLPKHYIVHGDELFYLFEGGAQFGGPFERDDDIELKRKVTKLWTNFAKFGNPTPPGSFSFVWHPATAKNLQHLSITSSPKMENYTRKTTLDFWMSLNTRQNQRLFIHGAKDQFIIGRKIEL